MPVHKKKLQFLGSSYIAPISTGPKLTTLFQRGIVGLVFNIVALVDSGASHSFVSSKLVKKYHLTVNLDSSMVVMLADSSQVEMCET